MHGWKKALDISNNDSALSGAPGGSLSTPIILDFTKGTRPIQPGYVRLSPRRVFNNSETRNNAPYRANLMQP